MPPGLVRLPDGRLVPRGSAAAKAPTKKPKPTTKTPAPPRASSPASGGKKPSKPKPLPLPDSPFIQLPDLGPAAPPPKPTDWRFDPGGGYVDIHSGKKVPLAKGAQEDKARAIVNDTRYSAKDRAIAKAYLHSYQHARAQQAAAFNRIQQFQREAAMRMPPGMEERWAKEFDAQMAASPEKYGLPVEDRPWWSTPGTRMLHRFANDAAAIGRGIAHAGDRTVGQIEGWANQKANDLKAAFEADLYGKQTAPRMSRLGPLPRGTATAAALGAPVGDVGKRIASEGTLDTIAGKALTNALLHGDFNHPYAIALEAAMLPIPLRGAPMVATTLARVGSAIRIAREAQDVGEGITLAAKAVNMTAKERRMLRMVAFENVPGGVPEDTRRLFQESKSRAQLWQTVRQLAGRKAADNYIALADARAYSVHRQIAAEIPDRIAALDAKVANGTATEQDLLMRKELGALQRFGVPADYYYAPLHDSGAGIPEWVQARYQAQRPDIAWQFSSDRAGFEGVARGGKNFGTESITKRLRAKLNPKNALRGLPENPVVTVNGLHVLGPITFEAWLKRVLAVMPTKKERTYWATWYQSFAPLFRQAFGEDT